jgi:DNA-binding MarR family transcriptional regulator
VTKQSMGALVDSLERWGYVERIPDPRDGRARIVRRTERGWAVERTARASIRALEAEWAQQVGPERMRHCRTVLEEIVAALDEASPAPSPNPR